MKGRVRGCPRPVHFDWTGANVKQIANGPVGSLTSRGSPSALRPGPATGSFHRAPLVFRSPLAAAARPAGWRRRPAGHWACRWWACACRFSRFVVSGGAVRLWASRFIGPASFALRSALVGRHDRPANLTRLIYLHRIVFGAAQSRSNQQRTNRNDNGGREVSSVDRLCFLIARPPFGRLVSSHFERS